MRGVPLLAAVCLLALIASPGAARGAPPEPTERSARCARPATTTTVVPPGNTLVDIAGAHRFSRGSGVRVAVIDTGVTPHPRIDVVGGGDFVGDGDGLDDCDLHGTLVAGIIAGRAAPGDGFVGVAPAAQIISIRQSSGAYRAKRSDRDAVTVGSGYGPLSTLAAAVRRAVELRADVINISETACVPATDELGDTAVRDALRLAAARDVVVVVAAGNLSDGTACREQNPDVVDSPPVTVATPAHLSPLVLTVGATTASDGTAAEFTLRGPWVRVGAPGTQVVALGPRGPITALTGTDGAVPLAGTSYAAPYVAGTAALIRSRFPDLTAPEVVSRIVRTAHGGGTDAALGSGVVDPVAALTAELPPLSEEPTGREIAAPAADVEPDRGLGRILLVVGLSAAVLGCGALLRRPTSGRDAVPEAGRTSASPRRW